MKTDRFVSSSFGNTTIECYVMDYIFNGSDDMLQINNVFHSVEACIEACMSCAQTCNKCFKACLEKDNINEMKEALCILVDCAELCYVTAACLSQDDMYYHDLCASCAELCEKCAEVCREYEDLHCKSCVDAAILCAELCRKLSGKYERHG